MTLKTWNLIQTQELVKKLIKQQQLCRKLMWCIYNLLYLLYIYKLIAEAPAFS